MAPLAQATRPQRGLPLRCVKHAGTGSDEAHHLGEALYHPHLLRLLDASQRLTLAADVVRAGPMTVGTLAYSAPVRVDTEAYSTSYQVNLALGHPIDTAVGSNRLRITTTRAVVYQPDVPTSFTGWRRPGAMLAVKLERDRIEAIANAYLGRVDGTALKTTDSLDITVGLGKAWLDDLRRISVLAKRALRLPRPEAASSFITHLVDEACLRLALASCPEADWPRDELPAPTDAVRRCVDLMDGLPQLELTLKDLAEYTGMSGRSLQLAFRAQLDTTPMRHLRAIRLDRVRADLVEPSLAGIGIAEIARARGFMHPGRFAQDYARRFGHLPSAERACLVNE